MDIQEQIRKIVRDEVAAIFAETGIGAVTDPYSIRSGDRIRVVQEPKWADGSHISDVRIGEDGTVVYEVDSDGDIFVKFDDQNYTRYIGTKCVALVR